MKEVVKCSLSGVAFTMDTDAYRTLSKYLDTLKQSYAATPDGTEIVADIEARIAELILSTQDHARVVEQPLVLNIIRQMGSAEDIAEHPAGQAAAAEEPRIPRRLYRDTEHARLSGVCAGIGRYFDVDPVWIRLGMFLPLVLASFGWLPLLHWTGPMMGNLFGVFVICYLIMWFAVPAARTARQKLEMNGERITVQSIGQKTAAASAAIADPDAKARPIVAEVVSALGQVVLIVLKIFAGLIVFGLIMIACALIIGLFSVMVGGYELWKPAMFGDLSLWVPVSGVFVVLIPVFLLIYVLMCMIASRKPGGKTVLTIFLLWVMSIIVCSCVALREQVGEKFRNKRTAVERALNTQIVVDGQTTTLEELLEREETESIFERDEEDGTLHISVPSKSIDIVVDKSEGRMKVTSEGKEISIGVAERTPSAPTTDPEP